LADFQVSIPDPYARTVYDGKPLDHASSAFLHLAGVKLGYFLSLTQGIGGAPASGGTHLEGRAFDLPDWDYERKVRVLRDLGAAAWYRPELPGVWGPHIHGVLIFENRANQRGIAPAAFAQIGKYDRREDGLAGSNRDPNPYRPDPKALFTLDEYRRWHLEGPAMALPETKITEARDNLAKAIWRAGQAAALLADAQEDRERAKAQIPVIREHRHGLKVALEDLPER